MTGVQTCALPICCCGAAALETCCSSRAGRDPQPPPATDPVAAEAMQGSGARGASPCVFIDNKLVAARRAGLEASLKGLNVAQAVARWLPAFVFVAGGAAARDSGSGSSTSYVCSSFFFVLCTVYVDVR